eukprot:jgi/Chrpa1/3183/Chrysochromulina_OHIO_Genome00008985-RA
MRVASPVEHAAGPSAPSFRLALAAGRTCTCRSARAAHRAVIRGYHLHPPHFGHLELTKPMYHV